MFTPSSPITPFQQVLSKSSEINLTSLFNKRLIIFLSILDKTFCASKDKYDLWNDDLDEIMEQLAKHNEEYEKQHHRSSTPPQSRGQD